MHALMRVQSFHLEHYAGTVYAVVLCLSLCLCHKLVFCFEMVEQIELFFLLRGFLQLVLHCVLRKFRQF